jgi:hypothetical protein
MNFPVDHPVMHTRAIWHPSAPRESWSVVLFRRTFTLERAIRNAGLWISASMRFTAWLNGERLGRGPARSDVSRWYASRFDLDSLPAGEHTLAIRVSYFGDHAGVGQLGPPAFLLVCGEGGNGPFRQAVSTGSEYVCTADDAREPTPEHEWGGRRPYYVVGSGERFHADRALPGWQDPAFEDDAWDQARGVCRATWDAWGNWHLRAELSTDLIGPMHETPEPWTRVAYAPNDLDEAAEAFRRGETALEIPARRRVRLLLDRGEVTNAYPTLTFHGGEGSRIRFVWAEAPYRGDSRTKGHRDVTDGADFFGHRDQVLPAGSAGEWTPLWFRSFRYVEMRIRTGDQPLTLDSLALEGTGWPIPQRGTFRAVGRSRDEMGRLWDVSLRTARRCAHETYFDCPHYEQAQFPGDTRVQAVFCYLVAGDDRLARKAMADFHASRLPHGLLQCRYPSRRIQVIATFSLQWIGMMHDFVRYRGQPELLTPLLPVAREIVEWFVRRVRPDGLLGRVDDAPFLDWTDAFPCGNAPQDNDGGSAILTMMVADACNQLADLEERAGLGELAGRWRSEARSLVKATLRTCWDRRRRLLRDTPNSQTFSVHAQVQAILAGAWNSGKAGDVLDNALDTHGVTQPGSFYYRYYVAQALKYAGRRQAVVESFSRWQRCLANTGLTTWPENEREHPRSDCHAWSISPGIELLQTVLGVEPAEGTEGFTEATFDPTLGSVEGARGKVCTPAGPIEVQLQRLPSGKTEANVVTPVPMRVRGKRRALKPGRHRLVMD